MRELDETDAVILRLLAEDGRRAYSEIGEVVDLTPPAVSDRVSRLEEAGVIQQFTIDVDRSALCGGVPVLIRIEPSTGALSSVQQSLVDAEATEHVFTTADGAVVAFARTDDEAVHEWIDATVDTDAVDEYGVALVAETEWTPGVDTSGFELECAECGNTVTSEGTSTRVDGDYHHFCCPSCEAAFTDRFERMEEAAEVQG
jgi:DNA-binding Lrp family transcriptional regulator